MSHSLRAEKLVAEGYLTREQLNQAHHRHREAPHLSFEEVCLQLGFLTEEDFSKILDAGSDHQRLGSLLVKERVISQAQLAQALAVQRRSGGLLGQILVRMECIDESALVETLARQFKLPFVPVGSLRPDRSLRRVLNATYALTHGVVPVALAGRRLTVAIADPTYTKPVDELASLTGYEVDAVLTTPGHVDKLRTMLYSETEEPETKEVHIDSSDEVTGGGSISLHAQPVEPGDDDTELPERLLQALLTKATEEGATTIHLDPGEHGPRLLIRVDGELQDIGVGDLGSKVVVNYRAIVRRLKTLAKLDLTERRKPLEGSFLVETKTESGPHSGMLRVAVLPTLEGESVSIRLANAGRPPRTLEGLGFSDDVMSRLREITKWPHGVLLVAGPEGSGKSSTLWACAESLVREGQSVVAVSTRQGFRLPNVLRLDLSGESGADPDEVLAHVAGGDPDAILLDEIESGATAEWAIRWARAGRLVLGAIRATGARSAIGTLNAMGIDPAHFAGHTAFVLGQRLLRSVTPESEPNECQGKDAVEVIRATIAGRSARRAAHLQPVLPPAYSGRFPVGEIWTPKDTALSGGAGGSLRIAEIYQQKVDIVADAAEWAARGQTTPQEILRAFSLWELLGSLPHEPRIVESSVGQRPAAWPWRRAAKVA